MSDKKQKKGLQALLSKQQKKKNAQNTTSSKKEDEDPVSLAVKQDPSVDAESPEPPKQEEPVAAKANDGGEDSSDDELNYEVSVGNKIVESKNDSNKEQEVVQADYMMKKDEKAQDGQAQKEKPKRNNASNITFGGGRPMFNRNRKNVGIGGDDFVGIDEIDDQGKKKENQIKRTAANGGREFQNLSSTAVASKKFEEEKEKESKPAERPRFFGKAKIGGGGDQNKQNTGTNIQYDFGVKFASQNKDKDKPKEQDGKKSNLERKEDSQQAPEVRKDKRRINQNQEKGRFGGKDQGLDDQDLEDGFEVVNDRNQKRRQQRVQARTMDEDGEQREKEAQKTSQIKRGGAFGDLGGNDSD